jgi:hypothetical protein
MLLPVSLWCWVPFCILTGSLPDPFQEIFPSVLTL